MFRSAGNDENAKGTASIPWRDEDRKLFVGGITWQTTDSELQEYFSQFGEIESVTVNKDIYTGQPRGYGFIVFTDSQTIDKILSAGNHYVNNKKVDPKRLLKKHGKIFVRNLAPAITDEDIREHFSKYGNVLDIFMPFDNKTKQRKSYCFVTFESKNVAYNLLKTPKQYIKGKLVYVNKAKGFSDKSTPVRILTECTPNDQPMAGMVYRNYSGGYFSEDMNFNDPNCTFPDFELGQDYNRNSSQAPLLGNGGGVEMSFSDPNCPFPDFELGQNYGRNSPQAPLLGNTTKGNGVYQSQRYQPY